MRYKVDRCSLHWRTLHFDEVCKIESFDVLFCYPSEISQILWTYTIWSEGFYLESRFVLNECLELSKNLKILRVFIERIAPCLSRVVIYEGHKVFWPGQGLWWHRPTKVWVNNLIPLCGPGKTHLWNFSFALFVLQIVRTRFVHHL